MIQPANIPFVHEKFGERHVRRCLSPAVPFLQLHSPIFHWLVNYSTELGYRNMHRIKTKFAPQRHPMLVSLRSLMRWQGAGDV